MKLINASLMATTENGYTSQMRAISPEGYWSLPPGSPNFNEELVSITKEHGIELIFFQVQAPGIIDPNALKQCQELGAIIFALNGDMREELPPWHFDVAPYVDCFLFTNMLDVRRMRERGFKAEWIELGFDPLKFRKWENPRQTNEIVAHFNDYGSNAFPLSQYRLDIVAALRAEFGDHFGVFGNFPGAVTNFNSDQVEEARNYSGAKIAINCSHFFCEKYSSDRLSRIIGTGGAMCLSHNFPNIEEMYTIGEHLDVFNNIAELIEKCHFYLQEDQLRNKISLAGQNHALNNYTFEKMCENIKLLYFKYHEKTN